jgi:L-lactate utilization protein LutB
MDQFDEINLDHIKESLEKNNFEVFVAQNTSEAKTIVMDNILPDTGAQQISYGDSMTVRSTGIFEAIKENPDWKFIEVFPTNLSLEEKTKLKRQALQADLFITGTNAVTEMGQLVNLDSLGNRIAGIIFGPKHVIIMVGRNKIVPNLESAMDRVKNYAAPINAKRLNKKTPCTKTGQCENCNSPERICNTWVIIEKSNPKGRIRVILINEDLGL